MTDALLACSGLDAGYDQLAVARGIDLSVDPGEVVAVLGPNGAGKTTLLLTLAGFLAPLGGTISVGGEDVKGGSPRRMNAAGVVLVPDSRALFTTLTTMENLSIAASKDGMTVDEALDLFPSLQRRAKIRVAMLSGGEQQMLAVARALVQGPKVLLIDEMSMGLAPVIVEGLMPIVRQVADEAGAGVVLVEQHVHLALEVADSALVLVHGDVALQGEASSLRGDAEALEQAYLGVGAGVAAESSVP
jgi:branched-chain amino acid transport system ATP-binding protein